MLAHWRLVGSPSTDARGRATRVAVLVMLRRGGEERWAWLTPIPTGGSPSTRRSVFASDRAGNVDLWTVAVDGSGLRLLTDSPVDGRLASFGPDGRIAFAVGPSTPPAATGGSPPLTGAARMTARQPTAGRRLLRLVCCAMKPWRAVVGLHGRVAVALTGSGDDLGVVLRGVVRTPESQPHHDTQSLPLHEAERSIEAASEAAAAQATDDLRQIVEELAGLDFEVEPAGAMDIRGSPPGDRRGEEQ